MNSVSPEAETRPSWRAKYAVFFLLFAVLAAIMSVALAHYILPFLRVKYPLNTSTPVYQQTEALILFGFRYLALTAFIMTILHALLPLDRVNWRRLAVGVIVLGGLIRFATPDMALNLIPKPDGPQYQLAAVQLCSSHTLLIPAGEYHLPSRMPIGPSLVMATTQWMRPDYFGMGIFSIWIASCLGLLLTFVVGRKLWSLETGLLAAALVALSPLHVYYTRQLMGEMPWALATLIAFYLVIRTPRTAVTMLLCGFVLGLCTLFKPVQLGIAAAFLGGLALDMFLSRNWRRIVPICFCCAGVVAGTLPVLLYHKVVMGGWLTTGYHVYDAAGASVERLFSIKYLFGPPIRGGNIGNVPGYAISALGIDPRPEHSLWYFPVSLLLVFLPMSWKWGWGRGDERQRLAWRIAALATLLYAGSFLFYGFQQPRFFLPILPLWAIVMAKPLADLMVRPAVVRLATLIFYIALTALAANGAAHLHVEAGGHRMSERTVLQHVRDLAASYDVIVTDEDVSLMTHFGIWSAGKTLIPIRAAGQPWYTDNPEETLRTRGVVAEKYTGAPGKIRRCLEEGRRVALWLRYPHRNKDVGDEIRRQFRITSLPAPGVPEWSELSLKEER